MIRTANSVPGYATVCVRTLDAKKKVPWEKQVGVLVPADSSGRQPGPHQAEYDFLQVRNSFKRPSSQRPGTADREVQHSDRYSVKEICRIRVWLCVFEGVGWCMRACCSSPSRAAKHGRCCVLSPSCLAASDSRYWCVVRFLPFQLSLSACEEKYAGTLQRANSESWAIRPANPKSL